MIMIEFLSENGAFFLLRVSCGLESNLSIDKLYSD